MTPRQLVVLAALLGILPACGGSSSSDSNPGPQGAVPSGPQGTITITLRPASSDQAALRGLFADPDSANLMAAQTLPDPTNVRFVVSNATTGFKSIQDVSIAGTQAVSIPVPAANGYALDVVSWASCSALGFGCGSYHYILKYGRTTGINVVASQQTDVELTLQPPAPALTPPATASEGDSATVSVTVPAPLRSFWYLQSGTTPFSGVSSHGLDTPFTSGTSIELNAPTPRDGSGNPVAGTWYFQAQYFILDSLTAGGSEWATWVYYYPNPGVGDADVSCPLTVPTGGIGVTVNY